MLYDRLAFPRSTWNICITATLSNMRQCHDQQSLSCHRRLTSAKRHDRRQRVVVKHVPHGKWLCSHIKLRLETFLHPSDRPPRPLPLNTNRHLRHSSRTYHSNSDAQRTVPRDVRPPSSTTPDRTEAVAPRKLQSIPSTYTPTIQNFNNSTALPHAQGRCSPRP